MPVGSLDGKRVPGLAAPEGSGDKPSFDLPDQHFQEVVPGTGIDRVLAHCYGALHAEVHVLARLELKTVAIEAQDICAVIQMPDVMDAEDGHGSRDYPVRRIA